MTHRRDFLRLSVLAAGAPCLPGCTGAAEYEGDAVARDRVGEELPRRICVAKKALKLKISLIFKNCPENPWIEA